MEILNTVWVWVLTILGSISLSSIFLFVVKLSVGGQVKKLIAKINVKEIADQATEKGVAKVKKISFTHNIQPLVESELKKINESSTEVLKKELKETQEKYDKLINIVDKLACYFDNSIGVADEKKADLKKAIADAKNVTIEAESVVVDEIVEEKPNKAVESKKPTETIVKVER